MNLCGLLQNIILVIIWSLHTSSGQGPSVRSWLCEKGDGEELQCTSTCAVSTASQQLIPHWHCHTASSATGAMCGMGNGEGTLGLLQQVGKVITNLSLLGI